MRCMDAQEDRGRQLADSCTCCPRRQDICEKLTWDPWLRDCHHGQAVLGEGLDLASRKAHLHEIPLRPETDIPYLLISRT